MHGSRVESIKLLLHSGHSLRCHLLRFEGGSSSKLVVAFHVFAPNEIHSLGGELARHYATFLSFWIMWHRLYLQSKFSLRNYPHSS